MSAVTCESALQVDVSTIVTGTSTGTVAYTGVGFQPKAVIFIPSHTQSDGELAGVSNSGSTTGLTGMGFDDGTTAVAISMDGQQQNNGGEGSTELSTTSSVLVVSDCNVGGCGWSGTLQLDVGNIDSLDADGFTVDYTTADANAYQVGYIAIGGADVSVSVGTVADSVTTGEFSVTGLGFQPTFLIVGFSDQTAAGEDSTWNGGFGMAVSSSERGMQFTASSGNGTVSGRSRLRTTKLYEYTAYNSDTILTDGDFVSMDADGFTLDRLTDDGTDRLLTYIAISGVDADITQQSQKTSTGTQAYTGAGLQPELLMLLSNGSTSASDSTIASASIGAATSTTERFSSWMGTEVLGWQLGDRDSSWESDEILTFRDGKSNIDAESDLSSLDSDGYTLDWVTADTTARIFLGIALKSAGGGGAAGSAPAGINLFGTVEIY